jgi:hypothetical protein
LRQRTFAPKENVVKKIARTLSLSCIVCLATVAPAFAAPMGTNPVPQVSAQQTFDSSILLDVILYMI